MLRVYSLFALAVGCTCLMAFLAENPKCNDQPLPANSVAAAHSAGCSCRHLLFHAPEDWVDVDTSTALSILMLNYNAYDSAYASKVRHSIEEHLPSCSVTEFWQGQVKDLNLALASNDVVVVTYPFGGDA